MKAECLKCKKQNGPNIPINADYAGWICPKCYQKTCGQCARHDGECLGTLDADEADVNCFIEKS